MARKQTEYTEFDRRYDDLMVEPRLVSSFEHEPLSQEELSLLLGRFTAAHLHVLRIAKIHPSAHALTAERQDMLEMAAYYISDKKVTWGDAKEIVDIWHADFFDYTDMTANLPGASAPRL